MNVLIQIHDVVEMDPNGANLNSFKTHINFIKLV